MRVLKFYADENTNKASIHISELGSKGNDFILPYWFRLVSAAVVCAILEMISALDPSSVTTEHRYLKLDKVSSLCPFALISSAKPLVVSHQLGLLSTKEAGILSRRSTRFG